MCGNFFKPASPSFLGGNNPVAQIGKAALSIAQPEFAPYIYGASAVGDLAKGNFLGAGLDTLGAFGALNGTTAGESGGIFGGLFGNSSSGWTSGADLVDAGAGGAASSLGGIASGVSSGASSMGSDLSDLLKKLGAKMPGAGTGGLGTFGNLLDVGKGAYGLYSANEMSNAAKQASQTGDPYGPYRPAAALQLSQLSANPSSVTGVPGYQFGYDQGLQALQRSMASRGYTGSGNMALALQRYGTDYATKFLGDEENRLAGLAGAQFAPSTASQIGLSGRVNSSLMQAGSIDALTKGLYGIFK